MLLNQLAYVSFLGQKYSDSEKYFKVSSNLTPQVTNNLSKIFASQKNLLVLYTHTSLEKADDQAQKLMVDCRNNDFMPVHQKQLELMIGDLYLLNKNYSTAKKMYKNQLQLPNLQPETEAHVLNNLAFASW